MATEKKTKKRKSYDKMEDVMKKIRLTSHETGEDCRCKRLKCFDRINQNHRKVIIKDFNCLNSYNEQSIYLAGLISMHEIKQRRSRKPELEASYNSKSYTY